MVTKEQLLKEGYIVLPKGGWIRLDPTILPHDWADICKDFGCDPDCQEIIIAVSGVKEIRGDEDASI
jgi:hypothetical protein